MKPVYYLFIVPWSPMLFQAGCGDDEKADKSFLLCRDSEMYRADRDYLERLWIRYAPYCPDRHFAKEIRKQFHTRVWEMYLACQLLDCGHQLRKTKSKGPDLCIEGDVPIWIEAVAVNHGKPTSLDRVKTPDELCDLSIPQEEGVWIGDPPSEESLILRCTHAMEKKVKKAREYKEKNIVSEKDPFIVAISLASIDSACAYSHSVFIKSFFGIGDPYVACTRNAGTGLRSGYLDRPIIEKKSGSPVSTRLFLGKNAKDISGVIGSCRNTFHYRNGVSDLMLVNNPATIAPYKFGSIRIGSEYRAEGGEIRRQAPTHPGSPSSPPQA